MGKFGFSFSWRRALGISAAKAKISRQIGIPLTRSGRQKKLGKALGCCVVMLIVLGMFSAITLAAAFLIPW